MIGRNLTGKELAWHINSINEEFRASLKLGCVETSVAFQHGKSLNGESLSSKTTMQKQVAAQPCPKPLIKSIV